MKRTLRQSARVLRRSLPLYLIAIAILSVGLSIVQIIDGNSLAAEPVLEDLVVLVVFSFPMYLAAIGVSTASRIEAASR